MDFRISREVYKISPIDYKHYRQEQTYEMSYIGKNEHIKSGIHPLGVFPKEVALELSIYDEKNRQLTNLIRDDNSNYSIQALNGKLKSVITLIEEFMSKSESQIRDENPSINLKTRLNAINAAKDTMERFHKFFVLSLPNNCLKWDKMKEITIFWQNWYDKDDDWQKLSADNKRKEFGEDLSYTIKLISENLPKYPNDDKPKENFMKRPDILKEYFVTINKYPKDFQT